ncbi:MAG: nitronate monooxygenase [Firmicutes bacterium]|nr:nitronate monooxygenase [Bacillota bacterium]
MSITKLLKIKHPILLGAMAYITDARLASAVSNAGGLGVIAGGTDKPADVLEQIRLAKSLTKDSGAGKAPFGLNIMLLSDNADALAKMAIEEGVAVVTTGAGTPTKYMAAWKEAGIIVMPLVASVSQAKMMERAGADAVIAEGTEAGGHIGATSTMALIPQVVDAVSVPVVAAGGIADGRGVAAAFALGASGAQIGTRFLVAAECLAHENYKKLVLKANDVSTIINGVRPDLHPIRALKTSATREFKTKEFQAGVCSTSLKTTGTGLYKKAVLEGCLDTGCFLCGQIAGLVKKEQTAKEIINEIITEANAIFKTLGKQTV